MKAKLLSIGTLWYLACAVAIAFVVPIVFSMFDATDVALFEYILFGIFVLYSIITGVIAGLKENSIIDLLFFPLAYLVSYQFFFVNMAKYFAIFYLLVALLAYGAAKK